MCYERYLRRWREADESSEMWQDFERTRSVSDPEPREEVPEPEPSEARETIGVTER